MRNEIFQGKFVGEERIYDMFTERVKDTLCLTGCHRRQTVYLEISPHFNLDTEMGTLVLPGS